MLFSLSAATSMVLVCTALCVHGSLKQSSTIRSSPVELTVFFQLTGQSFNFFTNELYPTYLAVNAYSKTPGKKLSVTLKPFTNLHCSSVTSDSEKRKCYFYKLFACASSLRSPLVLESDWQRLNFMSCSIQTDLTDWIYNREQILNSKACAEETCIDSTRLALCANCADGEAILKANSEEFGKLNVTVTGNPVVLFDYKGSRGNDVNVDDQKQGLDNLMALLCKKFPGYFDEFATLPRVATPKQFSFTDDYTFQLTRRCNYLTYASKIRDLGGF